MPDQIKNHHPDLGHVVDLALKNSHPGHCCVLRTIPILHTIQLNISSSISGSAPFPSLPGLVQVRFVTKTLSGGEETQASKNGIHNTSGCTPLSCDVFEHTLTDSRTDSSGTGKDIPAPRDWDDFHSLWKYPWPKLIVHSAA